MSVIDAIPIVDVPPPLPPEVLLADVDSATEPGEYRGVLLRSIPNSQIGNVLAGSSPQVVIPTAIVAANPVSIPALPLFVDGGLPWNPGIGPLVAHTASTADLPPTETGDAPTPPPPAGLVRALAAILGKGIGKPLASSKPELHPPDEPPKPPRGLYRRFPLVVEAAAETPATEIETLPDGVPRSNDVKPHPDAETIPAIATTFAFVHESPPLEISTVAAEARCCSTDRPEISTDQASSLLRPIAAVEPRGPAFNSNLLTSTVETPTVEIEPQAPQPEIPKSDGAEPPQPRTPTTPVAAPPVGPPAKVRLPARLPATNGIGDSRPREPRLPAPPAVARPPELPAKSIPQVKVRPDAPQREGNILKDVGPPPPPVAPPPEQPAKFVPEITIPSDAPQPELRFVRESQFDEPRASVDGKVSEWKVLPEIPQPASTSVGESETSEPQASPWPVIATFPEAPAENIAAGKVLLDAPRPEMKKTGESESGEPPTSAPPAVARTDDARQTEAPRHRPQTTDPAELVQRCVDACRQSAQQDRPFRVRLRPPELGALQVEIFREEHAVSARLQVETASARSALSEHLSELRQSLVRHGVAVDRIEVQLVDFHAQPQNDSRHETNSDRHGEPATREEQGSHGRNPDDAREEPPHRKGGGRAGRLVESSRQDEMDVEV
jgi:Flagellar hook-length control protein FliK